MKPTIIYTINRPEDKLPETEGKFIINAESHGYGPNKVFHSKHVLSANFTGERFESAYKVKEWLNKEEKYLFDKNELKQILLDFWMSAITHNRDDSDFPMGNCKKKEPDFETLFNDLVE